MHGPISVVTLRRNRARALVAPLALLGCLVLLYAVERATRLTISAARHVAPAVLPSPEPFRSALVQGAWRALGAIRPEVGMTPALPSPRIVGLATEVATRPAAPAVLHAEPAAPTPSAPSVIAAHGPPSAPSPPLPSLALIDLQPPAPAAGPSPAPATPSATAAIDGVEPDAVPRPAAPRLDLPPALPALALLPLPPPAPAEPVQPPELPIRATVRPADDATPHDVPALQLLVSAASSPVDATAPAPAAVPSAPPLPVRKPAWMASAARNRVAAEPPRRRPATVARSTPPTATSPPPQSTPAEAGWRVRLDRNSP